MEAGQTLDSVRSRDVVLVLAALFESSFALIHGCRSCEGSVGFRDPLGSFGTESLGLSISSIMAWNKPRM